MTLTFLSLIESGEAAWIEDPCFPGRGWMLVRENRRIAEITLVIGWYNWTTNDERGYEATLSEAKSSAEQCLLGQMLQR